MFFPNISHDISNIEHLRMSIHVHWCYLFSIYKLTYLFLIILRATLKKYVLAALNRTR